MPNPLRPRDPKWLVIGQQIREARQRIDMTQKFLATKVGVNHSQVSRDETSDVELPEDRLRAYCTVFDWDYDKIRAFLDSGVVEPLPMRAQREYVELFTLLDGRLHDGEEQDLIDEALQLVIMHRYPELEPSDFVPPE
jgi:transcriptional regulator with XRE-family HTH domain